MADQSPYEVASIDDLDSLTTTSGITWRPVRRRFGIEAFGANAWSAEDEGGLVIEEHYERDGHEELYLVVRGHAAFKLGDGDELDAPAGTLLFVPPDTRRTAVAREPGTTVLALGAKRGQAFEPSGWEWGSAAFALLRVGRAEEGRATLREGVERQPDHWAGAYNLACFEARTGRLDDAIEALRRAFELDPDQARAYAEKDSDLDPLREDPRFQELLDA